MKTSTIPIPAGFGRWLLSLCWLAAVSTATALQSGPVVSWSGNNHLYQAFIASNRITWVEAQADAAARGGYLATATSEAENNFIYDLVKHTNYWASSRSPVLGAIQPAGSPEPDGNWQWITGETWAFENWYTNEPNNFQGGQSTIQFWKESPAWDDTSRDAGLFSYVVEYQLHTAATGGLSLAIGGATHVAAGYPLELTGMLDGVAAMLIWDFDDGSYATNRQFLAHPWTAPGGYDVVLTAFNDTVPGGISATQTIHVISLEDASAYVATDGNDANDGTSWASAKATIQGGVNAVYHGGIVHVSNGTYTVANEIRVYKAVKIQSISGPEATIVDGGGSNRCFSLGSDSCILSGFTITNGYAGAAGGGVLCDDNSAIITNCVIIGNTAADFGGGVHRGTLYGCTVSQNTALNQGGGANQAILYDCTISQNTALNQGGGLKGGFAYDCVISFNTASNGGGLRFGTAYRCELSGNIAINGGGGAQGTILYHCDVVGNQANLGGGIGGGAARAYHCDIHGNTALNVGGGISGGGKAYDSRIYENEALKNGGGANNAFLYNCSVFSNETVGRGGGALNSDLFNCTLTGNSANQGGGIWQNVNPGKGDAFNCIVFSNSAADGVDIGWTDGTVKLVEYSCSPDLTHGVDGNITNAPMFLDPDNGDYRLFAISPCIDSGSNGVVTTSTDLAGDPRIMDGDFDGIPAVDIGAYEFQAMLIPAECITLPPVNLKSKGRTPITIMTTDNFDAQDIDPSTVRFAGAAPVHYSMEDVDDDGDIDLKLHFMTADLNIDPADGEVVLIGQTYDGVLLVGMDVVKVVPSRHRY